MTDKLTMKIGNRKAIEVSSIEDASLKYGRIRDKSLLGVSRMSDGIITKPDGSFVARVSYNGRVWDTPEWTPNQKPLLEAVDTSPRV